MIEDILPLSPLQEGFLFHHMYGQQADDVYITQFAIELDGPLDERVLRMAADSLLRRHSNLRACFSYEDLSQPVQVIVGGLQTDWESVDLSKLDPFRREQSLAQTIEDDWCKKFDLRRAPLIRFTFIRIAETNCRLLITHHHILMDGWSVPIFLRELFELYGKGGDQITLPPVTPYREYLAWLGRQDQGTALLAWQTEFTGFEQATRIAPSQTSSRPKVTFRVIHEFSHETTQALTNQARARGLTLNTLTQGTWGILLSRLTGQNDIAFGITVAGRPPELDGVERMVGLFINTVPLRLRVQPAERVGDMLQVLQDSQSLLIAHQYLGLAEIQRMVGVGELFDSLVLFENYPTDSAAFNPPSEGLSINVRAARDSNHYPISLVVVPGNQLKLALSYRSDLFSQDAAEIILKRLSRLLEALAIDLGQRIWQLDILDAAEKLKILHLWNATVGPMPELTLTEMFEQQAERTPHATAIISRTQALTYFELNERANRVAHLLIKDCIGPEDVVGILMPRTVESIVILLGILKSGAAYLAMDASYPTERLQFMAEDAGIAHLFTTKENETRLVGRWRRVLFDDEDLAGTLARLDKDNPSNEKRHRPLRLANLAYLIYTSGSTGRPKGVQVDHQALINLLDALRVRLGVTQQDSLLAVTTISFDIAGLEIYLPLMIGARCVLAEERALMDGQHLSEMLKDYDITVMQATPSAWRVLLDSGWAGTQNLKALCGGESMSRELAEQLLQRTESVWNMYGPTEATVWSTVYPVTSADTSISIGTPIWNTQIYLLDSNLQPVPVGTAGELYIGGAGLARGYHKLAALVAERFVANPYGASGTRMYRTGDLARWRDDGSLEYLGRLDHQVKIRGFRIELGEIEARLMEHESVKEVIVLAREDRPGEKRLVAYAVASTGQTVDPHLLRQHVQQKLPDYMVPALVIALQALPLTENGKLERKALPIPEYKAAAAYRAPQTFEERVMCSLFAEVLSVERAGLDDNFFELGGDSIVSIRLVSRAKRSGLVITVRDVFSWPTIETLARVARLVSQDNIDSSTETRSGTKGSLISLTKREIERLEQKHHDIEDILPLSPLQEGFLFHALYDKQAPDTYSWQIVMELEGDLDEMRLRTAAQALLKRHSNLRAAFEYEELSQPVQVLLHEVQLPWEGIDLTSHDARDQIRSLETLLAQDRMYRFNLSEPPLLRFKLLRIAPDHHKLILTIHHLVMDGWSVPIFMRELFALYAQEKKTAGEGLGQVVPYRQYLAWIASQDFEGAKSAWKEELTDLEQVTHLASRDSRLVAKKIPERITVELSTIVTQQLQNQCRVHGLTMNTLIQGVWGILLSRVTAREDVLFGITVAGRPPEISGVETMVGLFINTVPLRMRLRPMERALDMLTRLQDHQLASGDRQYLGLSEIQRLVGKGELFDTLVVFQNYPIDQNWLDGKMGGLSIRNMDGRNTTHYPLTLIATPGQRLSISFDFFPELFEPGLIEGLSKWILRVLKSLANDLKQKIDQLNLLGTEEQQQVLEVWNQTETEYPRTKCIQELFEEQVQKTPKAAALEFGGQTLSYEDLNSRANQLAHYLIKLGVDSEDVVGLAVARSPEMLIGQLGILKAGAAYLPLDLEYPEERLRFMLEDAKPTVLITLQDLLPKMPIREMHIVRLDSDAVFISECPSNPPFLRTHSEQVAYIIYTSGTTGNPKGVMVRHAGIVNNLLDLNHCFQAGEHDRIISLSSFGFDMNVFETLGILLAGGTIVIPQGDGLRDPAHWIQLIQSHGVTLWNSAPALLKMLIDHALSVADLKLPDLRLVVLGGDRVAPTLLSQLAQIAPQAKLVVLGGATEASIHSTIFPIESLHRVWTSIPYGRPMKNQRVYVLDPYMNLVPVGLVGELYLAGVGLGRGYHAKPGLTAERFVANPFGPPGTRMYRTGDLVQWNAAGYLEIIGRVDHQVKIRGFRVELGEVEARLNEQPNVRESVAVAIEDESGERQLIGYVVAEVDEIIDVATVRRALKRSLPEHMIPSVIMKLDAIPLTSNGKIDRRALPAPEHKVETEYRAAQSPEEKILCGLFAEVLRLERVGLDDNFFELGGHSLIATRLISRIRTILGIEISIRAVFESPTVGELLEVLKQKILDEMEELSEEEAVRLAFDQYPLESWQKET
jgi:amino acid adenylation domain-containing protein